jgi:hypothetical protein
MLPSSVDGSNKTAPTHLVYAASAPGSSLYGLSPLDPAAYVGVAMVLSIAAFAASYLPASRAVAIDPSITLRYERHRSGLPHLNAKRCPDETKGFAQAVGEKALI